MKVLFVTTGLAYGGAETQVVDLALRLKARGWQVDVVSMLTPQAYVTNLQERGIAVWSLDMTPGIPDPRGALRLIRIIRALRPHVVHSHMVHANILARVVRALSPVPALICTAHSIDERGKKGSGTWRILAYRFTDFFCDMTVQVSRAGLHRYVKVKAVPIHKIRYIPNGIDTNQFYPNHELKRLVRQELGIGNEFVWITVGRFAPAKDYPSMIRAFAHVSRIHPESRLLIVGDGPLRSDVENLVKDLKLEAHITFLGLRGDVAKLLNAADAFVMSSAWEGMPRALLEAASTGLPVVATDVGGNGEVVIDGRTGFLVPPRNPSALADAMLSVMALDPQNRQLMGVEGRKHVERNFSIDTVVKMWENLYCEVLKKRGLSLGSLGST